MKDPQEEFERILERCYMTRQDPELPFELILRALAAAYNLGVTNSAEAAKVENFYHPLAGPSPVGKRVDKQSILNLKIKE